MHSWLLTHWYGEGLVSALAFWFFSAGSWATPGCIHDNGEQWFRHQPVRQRVREGACARRVTWERRSCWWWALARVSCNCKNFSPLLNESLKVFLSHVSALHVQWKLFWRVEMLVYSFSKRSWSHSDSPDYLCPASPHVVCGEMGR